MENDLKMLEIILKANLSKKEIKLIVFLLSMDESTIKLTNTEMAKSLEMLQPNFVKMLKKLKQNQVVGDRKGGGIFVKSVNTWKSI